MSKKNQSTFVPTSEWAKHLKPFGKQKQAAKERQAAKKRIIKEIEPDEIKNGSIEHDDCGDN